jgi:hypothetical protein
MGSNVMSHGERTLNGRVEIGHSAAATNIPRLEVWVEEARFNPGKPVPLPQRP